MFLQSWKTPKPNGYLPFFVANTYVDNDAENQLFLCTDIMHRSLAPEIVILYIEMKFSQ